MDVRLTPDDAVLGYFRERGDEATTALDGFVRAPRSAAAVAMFRDIATVGRLVGGAADSAAGAEVAARTASALNAIGRTDLPTLAGVLAECRSLVTNDSGAMHFAAAVGLPVTALFGPTNEEATRPLGSASATVLASRVWCRPCMLRECPIDHRCMRGIPVDRALAAVRATL